MRLRAMYYMPAHFIRLRVLSNGFRFCTHRRENIAVTFYAREYTYFYFYFFNNK